MDNQFDLLKIVKLIFINKYYTIFPITFTNQP